MITLTYASITARKSIRYTIYFILFLIIGKMLLTSFISLYKKVFPPAPIPPTVSFGKLPKISFPEKIKPNVTFTLETTNGEFPKFDTKTNVYFMPKKSANLLSLDYTKEIAKRLGFYEPQPISNSVYKFTNKAVNSTLEANIITGSFSISYDLNADPSPISTRPQSADASATIVKNFLNNAELLAPDLTGEYHYQFLKAQGGGFIPAISQSDANIVRIDLTRKNYNDLPIVYASPNETNVWFLVSGIKERNKEIIAGEYHYFPVDETQVATYPIKNSDQAWQELLNGNFYLADGQIKEGDNIKVRKIYLAYYDSGNYTEFLQPIYVFEGDKNFVGYTNAITDEYYQN